MEQTRIGNLDRRLLVLLGVVALCALAPLMISGNSMDYDSGSVANTARGILENRDCYRASRHPGSPTYELWVTVLFKVLSAIGVSVDSWDRVAQYGTTIFALLLAGLFFLELRKYLAPWQAFFAGLCLVLNPVFLWHSWALADDIPALSLGFLGLWLVRSNKNIYWAALAMAFAVTCKGTAIAFLIAAGVYLVFSKRFKEAVAFGAFAGITGFFLFLPALASFSMNPSLAFSTLHYDSSPGDRPAMGWNFLKWTVHLYIPLSIWLGYLYAGRFFKKVWRPEKLEDIAILALLPLCFMDYYKFRYSVLVKLIGIGVCAYAIYQQRYRARFLTEVLPWLLAALVTIQMLFFAPYSRSFLLPAIPPLVLLIAQRMKGKAFWVACALITFIPMFNYFEVRGTAPYLRVSSRGYYRALIEQVSADYNDYGLQSSTYMLFSFP